MKTSGERSLRATLVCAVGIACNLCLSAGKIALGLLSGLVSVTADGFNNLSDCGAGIVALVSFRIAEKPADEEHPFGHRRAEYVASMLAGFIVLALAVELGRTSIERLFGGAAGEGGAAVWAVLGVSVAVKLALALFYRISAAKLSSDALKAAATDSLCDAFATAAVMVGAALLSVFPAADGWAGLLVSLFIAWQGVGILREAGSKLLGQAPDPKLSAKIKELVLSFDGVLGVHDLQIFGYGKGASFATIHAEMDARTPMLDAHAVIDAAETLVKKETGVPLTVHLDPVDLTNREESSLKLKVWEAARELTEGIELHDFRLIPGTNRAEFDVGVPYSCKFSDEELASALCALVREIGPYEPIVRVERE